jgi:hypothetical protein
VIALRVLAEVPAHLLGDREALAALGIDAPDVEVLAAVERAVEAVALAVEADREAVVLAERDLGQIVVGQARRNVRSGTRSTAR